MIRPLLAWLVLSASITLAQDAQEAPEPPPPAAEEAADGEPSTAGDPAGDASPFDYEASEQISEDLSVSFPVDI